MDEIEKQAIEATLDYTHGDKTHAARALGIGRKTLYRKLDQYAGGGKSELISDGEDSSFKE
jgi:DNA-binding NtrC family response regulator